MAAGCDRRARPGSQAVLCALLCVLAASCDAPPELQPDRVLRDSLGLTSRDRVHTVSLQAREGREAVQPRITTVRVGDRISFRVDDGLVHLVRFPGDSLSADARRWLEAGHQLASPPLLARGARWVVDFHDAPPGRYPFVMEGNGDPGNGAVVVEEPRGFFR